MIFVNSMSDLFHKDIDRTFIDVVFDAMELPDWHVYQVLTKRSSLMRNYVRKRYDGGPVPRHIWLGVSVEDAAHASRIEHLKQINSVARFISFEPLLGPVGNVDLQCRLHRARGQADLPADRPRARPRLAVGEIGLHGIGVGHVHVRMRQRQQADLAAAALCLEQGGACGGDLVGGHSSATPLTSVPIPSTVTCTSSPGARYCGGSSRAPAPVGVPVTMMSPGTSVVKVEI